MSFLYPRTVSISRPTVPKALGAVGYVGNTIDQEQPIAKNVQAAIQLKGGSGAPDARLPGDAVQRSLWKILVPAGAIANGAIHVRDVITDDAEVRYAVIAPYLTPLGYQLLAERLEI